MVSTRSVRYKFCEGERVLCYEPDPTKVKVLYDSKVLEVIESKDKRGRRTVEYLIHFQGWNSSWDRCVSEDFVLKDTEENRQLQRDLAEKSQLQLGAYLYRRERKKGGSSSSTATGGGTAKRARHDFSDDASSSSTQLEDGDGETVDTDSSSTLGSQPQSPWPIAQSGRAHIPLPAPLRDRLTFDYHLVAKRGKLSRLPASPTVAEILESFVKWFARAGAWHPPRPRYDPPQKPDILDVSCRLNLVREVADGLRVYFDFVLRGHLLYKQELNQYHKLIGQHIDKQEKEAKAQFKKETSAISESTRDASFVEQDMKSPKVPEYSHLPPDPDGEKNAEQEVPQNINQGEIQTKEQSDRGTSKNVSSAKESVRKLKALTAKIKEVQSATRNANIARSVGSSASSASEFRAQPILVNAPAVTTRTPLSLLLEKVTKWEIISHDNPEHLPCRIYGAIHLARLFVKLPDFLSTTQMPDFKLKLILKHVDMFIQYLDEHSEWFGESYYTADSELHPH